MKRIAVIDLGTNTFHLLIAEISSDGIAVLHKEKRSIKIGENGISKGVIAKSAQNRALEALKDFKETMNAFRVEEVHTTATSAFRNAANGEEFAQKIHQLTDIQVHIIDGKREAQLIYNGVKHALNIGTSSALIMDIGGGSVEFIIAENRQIQWVHSFEIGAQRLMDMFHHEDPIAVTELDKLEKYLDTQLAELTVAYQQYQPHLLIGASGTFDTLSHIYCHQEGLQPGDYPELPLTIGGFHDIHGDLLRKNRQQRLAIPGMIEMRVDMIVVASSLINYIIKRYDIDQIRVSSYALKEGLLHEIADKQSKNPR